MQKEIQWKRSMICICPSDLCAFIGRSFGRELDYRSTTAKCAAEVGLLEEADHWRCDLVGCMFLLSCSASGTMMLSEIRSVWLPPTFTVLAKVGGSRQETFKSSPCFPWPPPQSNGNNSLECLPCSLAVIHLQAALTNTSTAQVSHGAHRSLPIP